MTYPVSFITIHVKDLKKSADFYQNVFNWTPDPKSTEETLFFKHANVTFALCSEGSFKSILGVPQEEALSNSGTLFSINFSNEDEVQKVFLKATQSGAIVLKKPAITEWKNFAGFFKTPDGFAWEVTCKATL